MIDVIDRAIAITDTDQRLQNIENVFVVENAISLRGLASDTSVELHAPNR